jgi:threonine dehydrogenase-like Zn-dependent dehydrogenase
MCRNGEYTERGIKELDGYGSERWVVEAGYAIKIDPALGELGVLVEPASVVAKAWQHIEAIGSRAWFVLDRSTDGIKPALVADLGGTYHAGGSIESVGFKPDIIIEATGSAQLVVEAMLNNAAAGIVCLTGVSSGGRLIRMDAGQMNRDIVLENDVVFGTVNANLRHYRAAATALTAADRDWLSRLITRRLPLEQALAAFEPGEHVKVVIDLET